MLNSDARRSCVAVTVGSGVRVAVAVLVDPAGVDVAVGASRVMVALGVKVATGGTVTVGVRGG